MEQREVRSITVTYDDGSVTTFDPIVGFHRRTTNYDKGATKPEQAWIQHEIRWSDR